MKRIDRIDLKWFYEFYKMVRDMLGNEHTIILYNVKRPQKSYADGWYVELGKINGIRAGHLVLYFDKWPNSEKRVIQYCYKGKDVKQVKIIAKAGKDLFKTIEKKGKVVSNNVKMPSQLKPSEYRKAISELYSNHACYYGIYKKPPKHLTQKYSKRLSKDVIKFFGNLATAVIGLQNKNIWNIYPAVENRRIVTTHLRRERSARLALQVKIRDAFICRICKSNFRRLYGKLGQGFAEAHHILPLATKKGRVQSLPMDLITVCSNCHSMLHRMDGKSDDYKKLKRLFTGLWPEK